MEVSILGGARERLHISGDIEAERRLPFDPDQPRFTIAFSDGTLVEGDYAEDQVYRFKCVTEGAGELRKSRDGEHDRIELDWSVEWVTIAGLNQSAVRTDEPQPLPLFPGLDGEATLEDRLQALAGSVTALPSQILTKRFDAARLAELF